MQIFNISVISWLDPLDLRNQRQYRPKIWFFRKQMNKQIDIQKIKKIQRPAAKISKDFKILKIKNFGLG